MKTHLSLSEMAAELERRAQNQSDYVTDTRALTMLEDGQSLDMAGIGAFAVNDIAHGQIADRIGVPAKYYNKMRAEAPGLLAINANHWFGANPEKRLVRTLDGKARAFLSDRYRPIDNLPVAATAFAVLRQLPEVRIESCGLTDSRLYIKAVLPRVQGEVKAGDVVQAGILISNSEVGMGAVSVMPMTFRLVCTNGAIHAEYGQRKSHVGRNIEVMDGMAAEYLRTETIEADEKAFLMKIEDTVRFVADEVKFHGLLGKLRDATERRIEGDPVKAVEVLTNRYSLVNNEKAAILRHLIEGADLSAWGLSNAVTRASQDVADYDRATDLERLGGRIIELAPQDWTVLARAA